MTGAVKATSRPASRAPRSIRSRQSVWISPERWTVQGMARILGRHPHRVGAGAARGRSLFDGERAHHAGLAMARHRAVEGVGALGEGGGELRDAAVLDLGAVALPVDDDVVRDGGVVPAPDRELARRAPSPGWSRRRAGPSCPCRSAASRPWPPPGRRRRPSSRRRPGGPCPGRRGRSRSRRTAATSTALSPVTSFGGIWLLRARVGDLLLHRPLDPVAAHPVLDRLLEGLVEVRADGAFGAGPRERVAGPALAPKSCLPATRSAFGHPRSPHAARTAAAPATSTPTPAARTPPDRRPPPHGPGP